MIVALENQIVSRFPRPVQIDEIRHIVEPKPAQFVVRTEEHEMVPHEPIQIKPINVIRHRPKPLAALPDPDLRPGGPLHRAMRDLRTYIYDTTTSKQLPDNVTPAELYGVTEPIARYVQATSSKENILGETQLPMAELTELFRQPLFARKGGLIGEVVPVGQVVEIPETDLKTQNVDIVVKHRDQPDMIAKWAIDPPIVVKHGSSQFVPGYRQALADFMHVVSTVTDRRAIDMIHTVGRGGIDHYTPGMANLNAREFFDWTADNQRLYRRNLQEPLNYSHFYLGHRDHQYIGVDAVSAVSAGNGLRTGNELTFAQLARDYKGAMYGDYTAALQNSKLMSKLQRLASQTGADSHTALVALALLAHEGTCFLGKEQAILNHIESNQWLGLEKTRSLASTGHPDIDPYRLAAAGKLF